MAAPSPHHRRPRSELLLAALHRLDEAAARLNPFLMLIILGLAILNISCFTALRLWPPPSPAAAESAPSQTAAPYPR